MASLSPALAEELQTEAVAGVIILDAPRASIAARFGLAVGDIVQSVDGQPVATVAELRQYLVHSTAPHLARAPGWPLTASAAGVAAVDHDPRGTRKVVGYAFPLVSTAGLCDIPVERTEVPPHHCS
ncbi:MAG: PDZ domain-containing protein [Aliidongia sp.]